MQITPGTTSKSLYWLLRDSTTGEAKTGLTALSSGALASYTREGGTSVSIALSDLAAADSAYSSGGFKETSSSLAPGQYRLDVPNAALAAGASSVMFSLNFDSTLSEGLRVELQSSVSNVGSGGVEYTVLVQNDALAPLPGISVWITTDEPGSNVVAGVLTTSAFGLVTFYLDPGNYFLWQQGENFSGTNPTAITVTA